MREQDDVRIAASGEQVSKHELNRREFLTGMVALGVAAPAARPVSTDEAQQRFSPGVAAVTLFRVMTYKVYLGDKLVQTPGRRTILPRAIIDCFGENREYFTIYFLGADRPGDDNNPDRHPNTTEVSSDRLGGTTFVPVQQYTWYLDMLRNEDPVYAYLDASAPSNNHLECSEPVGEGELKDIMG